MGNGRMKPPVERMIDRQTDTTENITFRQLRWRAVKICVHVLQCERNRNCPRNRNRHNLVNYRSE